MDPTVPLELRYDAALDSTTLQADWLLAQGLIRFRQRSAVARWVVTFVGALAVAAAAAKAGLSVGTGLCALVVLVPLSRLLTSLGVAVVTGRGHALGAALLANSTLRSAPTAPVLLRLNDTELQLETPGRAIHLPWGQVVHCEPDAGMGAIICTSDRLGYRVPREAFGQPGILETLVQRVNQRARG